MSQYINGSLLADEHGDGDRDAIESDEAAEKRCP